MNKKAQEEIAHIPSIILIFFSLMLALVVAVVVGNNNLEQKFIALHNNEANIILLNYLRTNEAETGLNVAELIMSSYHNNNYDNLEKLTKNSFNLVYNEKNCPVWILKGQVNNQNIFDYSSDFSIDRFRPSNNPKSQLLEIFGVRNIDYMSSSMSIPTFNQDKINVILIMGCLR